MSVLAEALGRMSPEAYLEFEEARADARHELVDGWLYAMTGGTLGHELAAGALYRALSNHLDGGPCRAFKSDAKLRIGDDFYYPDVFVRCSDAPIERGARFVDDADAIVEVLSPSTRRYDRGDKRLIYWRVPSLRHYLLVDPDEPLIEHHTSRDGEPERLAGESAVLRLDSLGFEMQLADVYR